MCHSSPSSVDLVMTPSVFCRLIALAALRLHYINVEILSANPTLQGVLAIVLTQVELNYSIVACTIPCLKPFMMAINTNYGTMGPTHATASQASRSRKSSRNGSFGLAAMTSGKNKATMSANTTKSPEAQTSDSKRSAVNPHIYRGDNACSMASATFDGQVDWYSIGSNDSTKMMIRKKIQWTIESESGQRVASEQEINIQPEDAESV